ncbi:MAG TPA: DUF4215 domain-containing protein [Myxococcota bacterium]|jgi:cysteine-rich repeat protein|nr:DUF4215 domain-containing protein [Myxococcota bacterium]
MRVVFLAAALGVALAAAGAGCRCAGAEGVCGNGTREGNEECDDGNVLDGDGCTSQCVTEGGGVCGDGTVDAGEQCDDGNTVSNDGCSATCTTEGGPACGDGTVDIGEQCDDGNTVSGDGCSSTCMNEGTPTCGNNVLDLGEQCDDGNQTAGDGCSPTCQFEASVGACGPEFAVACGDTVFDDVVTTGAAVNDWMTCLGFPDAGPEIAYSFTPSASGDVTIDLTVSVADMDILLVQGDATGACDPTDCGLLLDASVNGGTTAESVTFAAVAGTTYYIIIETYIEGGETGGPFTLDVTCAAPPVCGNGAVEAGEECDDGNTTPGDGCSAACTLEPGICGDGVLNLGEECDDGNTTPGDGCDAGCQLEGVGACGPEVPAACGDSIADDVTTAGLAVNDWTACLGFPDDGPEVAYVLTPGAGDVTVDLTVTVADMDILVVEGDASGACTTACPNLVDASVNGGTTAETVTFAAAAGTTYYVIVDTYTAAGDTGGPFVLDISCVLAVCGDGALQSGEQCDDGNTTAGDGCDGTCQLEAGSCGDGIVGLNEQCDDANATTGDGCDNCVLECGSLPPPSIDCAAPVMGDTSMAGTSVLSAYTCAPGFTDDGNELVFYFTAAATEPVQFDLTGLPAAVDLDLYVTGPQSATCETCVDGSFAGAGAAETVNINAVAGETYQIIVDTYTAAGGAFTLTATCGFVPPAACMEDSAVALSGGAPSVLTVDNSVTTDDTTASCVAADGCPGGEDYVLAVTIPAGFTDLSVTFDHGTGDEFYAVFGDPMCAELECYDPYPATTGTQVFAGVSTGAADTTVYLLIEACAGGTGASTDLTLTAL